MHSMLANYAVRPEDSRGRLYPEPESPRRGCFQRDRDRIIHATAFRRLKHKTQVFISPSGDHYRTRLTHSLEVAQIARALARSLRLNEDLAEALALAHDLGHPPFGHAGEEALDVCMEDFGGFDHNDQTLRILIKLEHHYADFDGLNLSWETLEGVVKHNGPLIGLGIAKPVPPTIKKYNEQHDLALDGFPALEAQIAAMADDIAYDNHDLDDGLRAGIITLEMLEAVPHVAEVFRSIRKAHPDLEKPRLIHESIRRLIDRMVNDLIDQTERNLKSVNVTSADDIRKLDHSLAQFSVEMEEQDKEIKSFLFNNMYKNPEVLEQANAGCDRLKDLFEYLHSNPECLPAEWVRDAGEAKSSVTARVVADYIAGMTDRYATHLHRNVLAGDISGP
ncbi:MAG: deoxyguanosinetriphosphate triphosphohydrolase [Alphaproteobacteria bacterium]|jgi:dGTPase